MVKSKISGNILRFSFHFFVGLKLVVSESINFATGDNNMQLDATNSNVSEKCVLCKSTNTPATTVDEMEPNNISHLYEGSASKSLLTLPNAFLHYIHCHPYISHLEDIIKSADKNVEFNFIDLSYVNICFISFSIYLAFGNGLRINTTDTEDNDFCYEGGYQKMFCFNSETFENESYTDHAIYASIHKPKGKSCYIEIFHRTSVVATLLVYSNNHSNTANDQDGWNVMPYKDYVNSTAPYHSDRFYRIFNRATERNDNSSFSGNSYLSFDLFFGP